MPNNSSTSSSRLPKAFLIAAGAIALLHAVELFVLPINFFTFRSWEALIVRRLYFALPGPFYPERRVVMTEEGDLAPHTVRAVKKEVEFVTDGFGFRKLPGKGPWDVVIVGDSFTAGATLTQDDTLSEQLERRSHQHVYPLAPATMDYFLESERFKKDPPKIVIWEFMETFIAPGVPADAQPFGKAATPVQRALQPLLRPFPALAVLCDRLDKGILYGNASAMVKRLLKRAAGREPVTAKIQGLGLIAPVKTPSSDMLFRGDPGVPDREVGYIAGRLEAYAARLKARGLRLVFLPVPDKETVYWDLRPGESKPHGLALLTKRLKADGIEVVDVLSAFEAARKKKPGELLYHTDDSHWNPHGVALTAELLSRALTR